MRSFASDNNSGVHPAVMNAIVKANVDHAVGYGDDPYTDEAVKAVRSVFGNTADVFFVFNGTGANVVALKACTQPFHAIIAAETAHIAVDECGAPVAQTGCLLKEIATTNGKLTPKLIQTRLTGFGEVHHSQPKVVYLAQCTELGTVYTIDEIKRIADFIHGYGMYLHMDGARLANAAVSLGCSLKEMTVDAGVDILSFGGTKNGMMIGESVISFRKELSENLGYIRKQSAQLYSKMRYVSCQFTAYLQNNLWQKNAAHANEMAQKLKNGLEQIAPIEFTQSVDANILLLRLPRKMIPLLQKDYFFYIWNETNDEIRLVTSFDTTQNDIECFLTDFEQIYKSL
ncbi:MAG: low specificity L-threonine aldolase [Bacteroidaceae bacterium]|nr:low specificity L-threonine aldolase [Bacteroidaceae bacterium]